MPLLPRSVRKYVGNAVKTVGKIPWMGSRIARFFGNNAGVVWAMVLIVDGPIASTNGNIGETVHLTEQRIAVSG